MIVASGTSVGISNKSARSGETSDSGSLATNWGVIHRTEITFSRSRGAFKDDLLVGRNQERATKDGKEEESEGQFVHKGIGIFRGLLREKLSFMNRKRSKFKY